MISKFRELFRKDVEKYNDDLSNKTITKVDTKEIDETCTSVENYTDVLQYICANVHRSIALSTYLKEELTQIFGKHNARYRGEFFYYVWIVEFDGEIFQIFTADRKGTQFAIAAGINEDKSRVCINFLRKMEELTTLLKY